MIYTSATNLVTTATVTASGSDASFPIANVKNDTTAYWKGLDADETVTITLAQDEDVDLVYVHNMANVETVYITGKLNSGTVWTVEYSSGLFSGVDVKSIAHIPTKATLDTVEIRLIHIGQVPQFAYVWVGKSIDFDFDSISIPDNVTDIVRDANGNLVSYETRFSYRSISAPTKDYAFTELRQKIRELITNDIGKARPWVIKCAANRKHSIPDECMLGVPDLSSFDYRMITSTGVDGAFLVDDVGNYIVDDSGNRFVLGPSGEDQVKASINLQIKEVFGGAY